MQQSSAATLCCIVYVVSTLLQVAWTVQNPKSVTRGQFTEARTIHRNDQPLEDGRQFQDGRQSIVLALCRTIPRTEVAQLFDVLNLSEVTALATDCLHDSTDGTTASNSNSVDVDTIETISRRSSDFQDNEPEDEDVVSMTGDRTGLTDGRADQQTIEGSEVDQDVEAPLWETGGWDESSSGKTDEERIRGNENHQKRLKRGVVLVQRKVFKKLDPQPNEVDASGRKNLKALVAKYRQWKADNGYGMESGRWGRSFQKRKSSSAGLIPLHEPREVLTRISRTVVKKMGSRTPYHSGSRRVAKRNDGSDVQELLGDYVQWRGRNGYGKLTNRWG